MAIRIGLALAVSLLAVGGAAAQSPDNRLTQAAICSLVPDSLVRLNCFDKVFPKGGVPALDTEADVPAPAGGSPGYGIWQVDETKSAIDDSPTVFAYLQPTRDAGFTVLPRGLILRCMENTTSVILATDTFAIGTETGTVTARIDDQPARVERWEMSTDNQSVGLWSGSKAIPFMKELRDSKKLAFRVELRERTDLVFEDVTGIAAVVDRIAEACRWPEKQ